jgi:hypothetical protein
VATIVCNINAISASERPRHGELMTRLRGAIQDRRERPDGYSYDLDAGKVMLQEVAEWITAERGAARSSRLSWRSRTMGLLD